MKEIILVKNGELALKGLNRSSFEDKLVKNIKHKISDLGDFEFTKSQSTIMVEPLDDDIDLDEAAERISRVFGIAAFSRACECEKDFDDIKIKACEYLFDELSEAKTFKVEAKGAGGISSVSAFAFDGTSIERFGQGVKYQT